MDQMDPAQGPSVHNFRHISAVKKKADMGVNPYQPLIYRGARRGSRTPYLLITNLFVSLWGCAWYLAENVVFTWLSGAVVSFRNCRKPTKVA